MAEQEKATAAGDGGEGRAREKVSEDNAAKAEAIKNKANEFFKCKPFKIRRLTMAWYQYY